jgi:hypothetical protein
MEQSDGEGGTVMVGPIILVTLIALAVRWAWQDQDHLFGMTRTGFSWLATRIGVATNVQLTSVMSEGANVLLGFRPGQDRRRQSNTAPMKPVPEHLLLSSDSDARATIGQLRQWEMNGATIVMWRDRIVGHVEFSQLRTGQQVTLSVIPNPAATAA